MQYHIDHGSIEVVRGDITDQDTVAIVNAANNLLWMGAGVAGAIKRKGGHVIEEEAIALGPVEVGQAVLTTAGTLKAAYVIHAAVMGQDLHTDAKKILTATASTLRLAEATKISSISFPAIGTGVGGFSVFHCARIMLTEAISFLMNSKHLRNIRFVLFDQQALDAFSDELKLQFSSKRH
jgi:O-acetyl-ADP-ribose deacetylase